MITEEQFRDKVEKLKELARQSQTDEDARAVISRIAQITRMYRIQSGVGLPSTPLLQAQEIDPTYVSRPHLEYLSERIVQAVKDVERGQSRMLAISMPPRSGKSLFVSRHTPLWLLRRHPEWNIMSVSYSDDLTIGWARELRKTIESHPELGIALADDGGAGGRWSTVEGGGLLATSTRGDLIGRGARVMIIDDPVKDFVDAHQLARRERLWNWWLQVAYPRLEKPFLVMVVMTRWHEDDMVGRIFSPDHEGNPKNWERIALPAIAEEGDVLGREPGQPLYSPLVDYQNDKEALEHWDDLKEAVGSYTFASQYQQRPAPAKGAIFDSSWWRFWTKDPSKATEDGRIVYLDPDVISKKGNVRWLDSWDATFKGAETSDWVVGQRWMKHQANRYLIAQQRGKWSFTETMARMKRWSSADSPYGRYVHERLIEDKANGPAIIDSLKDSISGIKPINPNTSKEGRARAVTPAIESGNVYLPYPGDPGNEWVNDLLSELRNFPHDVHDDQVDGLTQALLEFREKKSSSLTVPEGLVQRNPLQTYQNSRNSVPGRGGSSPLTRGRSPLSGRTIR